MSGPFQGVDLDLPIFLPPIPQRTIAMGQMHFDVPEPAIEFFRGCRWEDAYLCGIEGVPWQTRSTFEDGRLTLTRSVDSSAKLFVTCPVPKIGYRVLSSCSLRCQEKPHRYLVELARGCCFRVRVQADTWQRSGLALSDKFDRHLQKGTQRFLDALYCPDDPKSETDAAIEAIMHLEIAASELGSLFSAQSITYRARESRLSTMLGVSLIPSREASSTVPHWELIGESFNAAAIRISWGDVETDSGKYDFEPVDEMIESCSQLGLRVIGGPIIDYEDGLLPNWLTLLDGDFEKLISVMTDFVEATVVRYRGRVHLWNAAAGLNTAGPLRLDDEQIMRLSISAVQTIRRIDPNTPVILSLDQPCGEYLAKHQDGISPLHFADALLRSGLGLAGIGLNFRFGYSRGETQPRSSIEFAQLIDRWATLSAPLLIQISVAGAPDADPSSRLPWQTVSLDPQRNGDAQSWAEMQHEFSKSLIDVLLAKQIVHAVVWEGWSDRIPHLTPSSGLLDAKGQPRPLLEYLTGIRNQVLL